MSLSAAAAAEELPVELPTQGEGGPGGTNPDPGGPGAEPINPDKTIQDTRESLDNGGAGYGGAPPGAPDSVDEIGGRVVEVLAENWAVTAGVTAGFLTVGLAGWFLASRYVDPKIALQSPERSMLYGFVKGNPGVHLKQLSSEFRMKTSTVLWHVRKLEAAELIRSKKANGYRVFYPVSGGLEASRVSEAVTALSNANARDIFSFLVNTPQAHPRLLTDSLAINPGTIRWHLKKLVKAGLLEEQGERRGLEYRATELGLKALRQVQGLVPTLQVQATPGMATPTEAEVTVYN